MDSKLIVRLLYSEGSPTANITYRPFPFISFFSTTPRYTLSIFNCLHRILNMALSVSTEPKLIRMKTNPDEASRTESGSDAVYIDSDRLGSARNGTNKVDGCIKTYMISLLLQVSESQPISSDNSSCPPIQKTSSAASRTGVPAM